MAAIDADIELADELWRHLDARELSGALPLSEQLLSWFDQETDAPTLAWLGEVLLIAAEQIGWFGHRSALRVIARILTLHGQTLAHKTVRFSTDPVAVLPPRRRCSRERSLLAAIAKHASVEESRDLYRRVTHSVQIYDRLIDRFAHHPDPDVRRFAVSARINRGAQLVALGRYRAAVAGFREDFSIDETSIAGVLRAARPDGDGDYRPADHAAAIFATTLPIGGQPMSAETLGMVHEILADARRRARGTLQRGLLRAISTWIPSVSEPAAPPEK